MEIVDFFKVPYWHVIVAKMIFYYIKFNCTVENILCGNN